LKKELTIAKLKESLEKDYGEYGRTQYVIEKLQNDLPFPKSDQLYIERMIKLCKSVIEEQEPEETPETVSSSELIKCYRCDLYIKFDEKSIRENNFWFHDKCFEKIPIQETEVSQKIKPLPKAVRQHVIVKSMSLRPQMAFSGGLLTSLVGTTYFLAGDWIAAIVGIWAVYYTLQYSSHRLFQRKDKKDQL